MVSGSFPIYNISWGDSLFDVVDSYSDERFPARRNNISLVHRFRKLLEKPEKHQLKISVCNQFSCGERSILIKVTKCGPPLLKINMEPKLLPRDQQNAIFLEWQNLYPECASVEWNEYSFQYHLSELSIGKENYFDKIKSTIEQDQSRVKLTIPEFTLPDKGE